MMNDMSGDTPEFKTVCEKIDRFYRKSGRHDLPWRCPESDGSFDPYKILVSEMMLQQTQVVRVIPKYVQFLVQFPSLRELASAELGDVLRAWQGLGYNRRAKYLWQAANLLVDKSHFPEDPAELAKLPGIGPNTAAAVVAYAFNHRVVFVETNIRTVCIYHFARDAQNISDDFIRDRLKGLVEEYENNLRWAGEQMAYRQFYWALMDYGSWLKTRVQTNAQSKHYAKQSRFQGSRRQVRGAVLRTLAEGPHTFDRLQSVIVDERLADILVVLLREGLVRRQGNTYRV